MSYLAACLMALSIAGKPTFSLWVLLFLCISSGLVLCGCVGGLWLATLTGAKPLNEGFRIPASGLTEKPSTYPDTLAGRAVSRATKATISLLLLLSTTALGWLWRDHQLASNIVMYQDVFVAQKVSDNRFFMQPARMKPIDSEICKSTVDWKAGETLRDWTFEQLQGCKRVISYHRYQGVTNASLSTR